MNATVSPPFTDVPEQIVKLIYALCVTVAERCGLHVRTLTVAEENYINGRLLAARKRFRDLLARIRAGKPPKPRPRKPKPPKVKPKRAPEPEPPLDMGRMPKGWRRRARADLARERRAAKERAGLEKASKPVPLWRALRQDRFGWLCPLAPQIPRLRHSAPGYANHLRKLLADPEMQALLKAHRCLGEALRSVCHALGVERSPLHLDTIVAAAPVVTETEPAIAAPVAPDKNHVFRPATKRPPTNVERAMPTSRASPGPGVVIVDYWGRG